MAKTKLRKFHKIKIHHNRYLIWAVAYVLFVAIAMTGYLKVANIDLENEGADNIFAPMHSYRDARLGFAIRYPADWGIEASSTSVAFVPDNSSDDGVTVSVTTTAAERDIRKILNVSRETTTQLDSTAASRLIHDLGDGHFETVIIAPYNHKLYVIRGSDNLVQKILLTFHFLK